MSQYVDRAVTDSVPLFDDAGLAALLGIPEAELTAEDRNANLVASALIQNYTDRLLVRGDYTERHFGANSTGVVQLLEYPVIDIVSINDVTSGQALTGWKLVRPTGMLLGWWGCELEVVYTAGYEPLPADLQAAFLQTFKSVKAAGDYGPLGPVKRAAVTDVGSVEYGWPDNSMAAIGLLPAAAVALLRPYCNHAPLGIG